MNENDVQDLKAMLAVIWKKLDDVERKVNQRGHLSAPITHYYEDLRKEAKKVREKL